METISRKLSYCEIRFLEFVLHCAAAELTLVTLKQMKKPLLRRCGLASVALILLVLCAAPKVAIGQVMATTGHSVDSAASTTGESSSSTDATDSFNSGLTVLSVGSDSGSDTGTSPRSAASANSGPVQPAAGAVICGITHLVRCIEDLGQDDAGIFTSPARLQRRDLRWILPVGTAFGLAMAYDAQAQQTLGAHPNLQSNMNTFSEFGSFYASGAEGAGFYFAGLATKNPKLAETGRLGAEAVIDSGTVTLLIKLASNRHRPLQGNGQGHFWADGSSHWEWDSSFPSDHATASMSLARIIAGEYPRWYVQTAAYGFAESISLGRVLAKEHFPSDVILGQTIGFLTGTYLLHHRALYAGNGHRNLVSRMIDQVQPEINPATRTMGVGLRIAFGQ